MIDDENAMPQRTQPGTGHGRHSSRYTSASSRNSRTCWTERTAVSSPAKGKGGLPSQPALFVARESAYPTWTGTYIRLASRWISSAIVLSVFFIKFFNCSTDFNGVSLNARITSPG